MKKLLFVLSLTTVILFLTVSCKNEGPWQSLFNGENLDNWDKYLGSSLGSEFDSLANVATTDKVFSVVDENGVKLIRISGEINGSLATREVYENYHLRLVYKWGETVYSRRNSGLLYHSYGDFGTALETWMPNIEFQLMDQSAGSTYLMADEITCEIPAVKNDKDQYIYAPGAEPVEFIDPANGRYIRNNNVSEKPIGEWNIAEIYCLGSTTVHVLNGVTMMVITNTGILKDDVISPLTSGKIQLQSEGGELFVKSFEIKPVKKLPEDILQ